MQGWNKWASLLVVGNLALAAHAGDVVVVVGAASPIAGMNKDEVRDLFLGRPVVLAGGLQPMAIEQAEGSDQREDFHGQVTGKSGAQLKAYWSKLVFSGKATPPREAANAAELRRQVGSNPKLVGYLGKGQLDPSVKVVFTP